MDYTVLIKRYAPFEKFGLGFHGDTRKGASAAGTARTWCFVCFNLEKGVLSTKGHSSPTWHAAFPGKTATQTPKVSVSNQVLKDGTLRFLVHCAGGNPLTPKIVTPDIDTFVDFTVTADRIVGIVRGDDFPSAEVFLFDGQMTFDALSASTPVRELAHFVTPHGPEEGPATRLWGSHEKNFVIGFDQPLGKSADNKVPDLH